MDTDTFNRLVSGLLDGTSQREDVLRLERACGEIPEMRRRLADLVGQERQLGTALEGEDGERRFAAEVLLRMRSGNESLPLCMVDGGLGAADPAGGASRAGRMGRWRYPVLFAAAAALVVLALVTVKWTGKGGGALVRHMESATFAPGSLAAQTGGRLESGKMVRLESGLIEFDVNGAVSVLVEGPACFALTGERSMRLESGRLVAKIVKPEGRGFSVDGPHGRIVDLGTQFGLSVNASGEMEVHVMKGSVEASSNSDASAPLRLHQQESASLGLAGVRAIPNRSQEFLTDLPPHEDPDSGFIRWTFDEADGPVCWNSGHGLAEGQADAVLRKSKGKGGLPQRVSGRIGRAIAFDGMGGYLEVPSFQGIEGNGARTVSLWARVPQDLKPNESYSLIGWGNADIPGAGWQISINPHPEDGPMGGLRVGVKGGKVVGATDLRDGAWHHLAVVMYGGPEASTSTHVLLYVDGKYEVTTRKQNQEINTRNEGVGRGIWMGKNIARPPYNIYRAYYFRGEIDDVRIYGTALNQTSLVSLMTP